MTEQKIEQVFRDALSNHEADVNPNVWTNIQQGLQAPVSANPVSGSSSALKSAGILGKMGVKSLLLVSAVTVSVIGTVIYFATKKAESKVENSGVTSPTTKESIPVVHDSPESTVQRDDKLSDTKNITGEKPAIPATKNPVVVSKAKSNTENPVQSKQKEPGSGPSTVAAPASSPKISPRQDHPALPGKASSANSSSPADNNTESVQPAEQPAPAEKEEKMNPGFDHIEKYLIMDNDGKQSLPNVFTPDGDGLNDVFTIKTNGLKMLEVIIFDRSGKKIHAWKSLNGEWNGKLDDGSEAPAGNYFYSLDAETLDGKICIAQSFLKLAR